MRSRRGGLPDPYSTDPADERTWALYDALDAALPGTLEHTLREAAAAAEAVRRDGAGGPSLATLQRLVYLSRTAVEVAEGALALHREATS